MHKLSGGCHCGNIQIEAELTIAPAVLNPRACDCDFCRKHAASYISDPEGTLLISIKDKHHLGHYRQGSGLADCLLCKICGILVAITFQNEQHLFATVNSRIIDGARQFGARKIVLPRKLSDSEKVQRWRENWFSKVRIKSANA